MDKLWAPWRLKYIKKTKARACVFCRIRKSKKDTANYVLMRAKFSFAVLNIYPYNNGHIMIAPYRHKSSLKLLKADETNEMMVLVKRAQSLLERTIKPEGYNIGINEGRAAGAGVAGHIHIHIVPRWMSDVNFMPVIGQTNVIPQSLDDLCEKLKKIL